MPTPFKFFVAGCQRSGTTMLRLVLDSHPDIRCFDEAVAYEFLTGRHPEVLDVAGVAAIGFKIPRFSEQLGWPQQIDPDYGRFSSFYHGEKTLFIVRDVCDVVSSMVSLKADASATWIERYAVNILRAILPEYPGGELLNEKFAELEARDFPRHLLGALYWEAKNQGLLSMLAGGGAVLPISYEAFVKSPRADLERVMQFLGLPWSDALLMHHQHEHQELDERGLAIGNTDPKRAIDGNSVGKAALCLTGRECDEILAFVESTRREITALGIGHDL